MSELASRDDALALLQAYSGSAALGAALELGLPWLLAERPLHAAGVAGALGIPLGRCRWWLQVLAHIGLLERVPEGYAPSPAAARAILGSYSRESWAFLAREERERFGSVLDLAARLALPEEPSSPSGAPSEDYVAKMAADPRRARAFTRMVYELHLPLAGHLAGVLDLAGVRRMLDLGGGSGVVSLALLRRHPGLTSVVVDIENVCAEGRCIAVEHGVEDRITYLAGDLLAGELPRGFDLALECDVGVYTAALFSDVRASLRRGGRFVIVDQLAESEEEVPVRVLHWGFTAAVSGPGGAPVTWARLRALLVEGGFTPGSEAALAEGYRLIEGRA
ncbi:MAG: methyltransferase [Actinomycetota bacterium]